MTSEEKAKIQQALDLLTAPGAHVYATIDAAVDILRPMAGVPSEIPYDDIVACYHTSLPMLARVKALTAQRRGFVRQRWEEKAEYRQLDFWFSFFERVRRSDFLSGRRANERGWRPDFEWLVRPGNFVKIMEGRYDNMISSTDENNDAIHDFLVARQAAQ